MRSYLARLNVPLRVWSPEPEIVDSGWGEVESIATRQRLERSMRDLRDFLDRQIVVWVEGLHLPQQLRLGAAAAGRLRRVTEVGPPPPAPDEDADLDPGLRVAELPDAQAGKAGGAGEDKEQAGGATAAMPVPAAAPAAVLAPVSFEETVEVNVVNVDVVVTGKDGARVRDLTREDFRLYEDGEPVEISHFQAPLPAVPGVEPPNKDQRPAASAQGVPDRPTSLIVYLDLVRLSLQQKARSLRALDAAFAAARESVRVMIVVDDGSIEIPLTFTRDGAAIRAAIAELERRKPRASLDQRRDALHEMAEVREAIITAHSQRDEEVRRAALTTALDRRRAVEGTLPLIAGERKREVRDLVGNIERLGLGLGASTVAGRSSTSATASAWPPARRSTPRPRI